MIAPLPTDTDLPHVLELVLQTRSVTHDSKPIQQVLVKWSGWPSSLATWDGFISLKQQFLRAPAWGQAASQGRRNVSTPISEDNQVPGDRPSGPRSSNRLRKQNPRVSGPEWVHVLAHTERG